MLEDNWTAHLPVFLAELGENAEAYARGLDDEHRGEHVPVEAVGPVSLPDITSEPEHPADRLARLDDTPASAGAPKAPTAARSTTARRPAARRKAT
jgi:hypothetical protein